MTRPRDNICCIHHYTQKEDIMRTACLASNIIFESSKISLFMDLSKHTLQMRALIKPLLALLQTRNISYRWGFPFALHVHHQDASVTFRSPQDLPLFLKTLNLPDVTLPEWDFLFPTDAMSDAPSATESSRRRPLLATPWQQCLCSHLESTSRTESAT